MWKLQHPPPLKKVTPFFPRNPSLKVEVLSGPPFWKLSWRLNFPPAERGVQTMFIKQFKLKQCNTIIWSLYLIQAVLRYTDFNNQMPYTDCMHWDYQGMKRGLMDPFSKSFSKSQVFNLKMSWYEAILVLTKATLLPNHTDFFRFHINQNWHFLRLFTRYGRLFSEFINTRAIPKMYILFRVHITQY